MSKQRLKRSLAGKDGKDDNGDAGADGSMDIGGKTSFMAFALDPGAVTIPLTGTSRANIRELPMQPPSEMIINFDVGEELALVAAALPMGGQEEVVVEDGVGDDGENIAEENTNMMEILQPARKRAKATKGKKDGEQGGKSHGEKMKLDLDMSYSGTAITEFLRYSKENASQSTKPQRPEAFKCIVLDALKELKSKGLSQNDSIRYIEANNGGSRSTIKRWLKIPEGQLMKDDKRKADVEFDQAVIDQLWYGAVAKAYNETQPDFGGYEDEENPKRKAVVLKVTNFVYTYDLIKEAMRDVRDNDVRFTDKPTKWWYESEFSNKAVANFLTRTRFQKRSHQTKEREALSPPEETIVQYMDACRNVNNQAAAGAEIAIQNQ